MILEIALCIAALGLFIYFNNDRTKYKNLPPGPRIFPVVGNMIQFMSGGPPHLQVVNWAKKYGDIFYMKLGTARMIVLNDPKLVREVFSRPEYSGKWRFDDINDIFDNPTKAHGIINSDGEDWEQIRRFTLRNLRDLGFGKQSMENCIMDEVSEFIDTLGATDGKPLNDLRSKVSIAVVNSLWTIISGKRHKHNDPLILGLSTNLHNMMVESSEKAGILFLMPWIRHIIPEMSGFKAMRRALGSFREFLLQTVEEHEKEYSPDYSRDFIDVFLKEIKESKDSTSTFHGEEGYRQLIGSISDLFMAGTDTTATTFTWTILYLSKHKEVQKKLQKEIESITNNSRYCTLSDRPNMPYMEAVLSEVLRYSTLVPMGAPHRALATKEWNGYTFPKDFNVTANMYYIHFDPKHWGDPLNFRPERFIDENNKFKKHESLIAFSTGKRQCVGESLARDSLFLFLTNVFQKFDIEVQGEHDLTPTMGFILTPKKFNCVFKERK